jgi:hypothetical protein
MTHYRSPNRSSHHLPNILDLDPRFREHLSRTHTPADGTWSIGTVPADGTLLDVVPLPDTGNVLMIVAHVVPASAAPPVDALEPLEPAAGETSSADSSPTAPPKDAEAPLPRTGARPEGAGAALHETETRPNKAEAQPENAGAPLEGLRIDRPSRSVWVDGREVGLTFQEFELLAHLTAHPWTVLSRAQLMRALWPTMDAATRTVDIHVHRLRRKLGRVGPELATVRRVGYVYRPDPANRSGSSETGE